MNEFIIYNEIKSEGNFPLEIFENVSVNINISLINSEIEKVTISFEDGQPLWVAYNIGRMVEIYRITKQLQKLK